MMTHEQLNEMRDAWSAAPTSLSAEGIAELFDVALDAMDRADKLSEMVAHTSGNMEQQLAQSLELATLRAVAERVGAALRESAATLDLLQVHSPFWRDLRTKSLKQSKQALIELDRVLQRESAGNDQLRRAAELALNRLRAINEWTRGKWHFHGRGFSPCDGGDACWLDTTTGMMVAELKRALDSKDAAPVAPDANLVPNEESAGSTPAGGSNRHAPPRAKACPACKGSGRIITRWKGNTNTPTETEACPDCAADRRSLRAIVEQAVRMSMGLAADALGQGATEFDLAEADVSAIADRVLTQYATSEPDPSVAGPKFVKLEHQG